MQKYFIFTFFYTHKINHINKFRMRNGKSNLLQNFSNWFCLSLCSTRIVHSQNMVFGLVPRGRLKLQNDTRREMTRKEITFGPLDLKLLRALRRSFQITRIFIVQIIGFGYIIFYYTLMVSRMNWNCILTASSYSTLIVVNRSRWVKAYIS